MARQRADLGKRFWAKVKKGGDDDCWVWTGCKIIGGYGRIKIDGKLHLAHRVSFEMEYGPIPDGKILDHKCCNCSCVNPSHLRACTQNENIRNRMLTKTNTSGYKGASWNARDKRWIAYISVDGRRRHLGQYETAIEAHLRYLEVAKTLHGQFANDGHSSLS